MDRRALVLAAERGVIVTLATGRLYSGTRHVAEACGLAGPVACVDGSHVVQSGTGVTLEHHGISGAHAEALREHLEAHGPATYVFAADAIVHDDAGDAYLKYVATWSRRLERTGRVTAHAAWRLEAGVTGLVAVGTEAQIRGVAGAIAERLAGVVQAITFPTRGEGGAWGMVARAFGRDKGSAVEGIAARHGVTREEIVVVGDWLNDVPMFRAAGRSFAMGQAPDEVKAEATDVLEETGEQGGGVARAVAAAFGVHPR